MDGKSSIGTSNLDAGQTRITSRVQHLSPTEEHDADIFFALAVITLAGIACIIMREVYATMGESIYPNPSFLSRDFPEASGRLLRNLKEFTFQDMAN